MTGEEEYHLPTGVREFLVQHIERERGITPGGLRFVWTGLREGRATWEGGEEVGPGSIVITGAAADEIRIRELNGTVSSVTGSYTDPEQITDLRAKIAEAMWGKR